MSKPIKDYTLGEAQEICNSIGASAKDCPDCPLQRWCDNMMGTKKYVPSDWNLTDPPRWTPEEVERAKAIRDLWPGKELRLLCGLNIVYVKDVGTVGGCYYCSMEGNRFPSLKINETVTLEAIINDQRG